ncbi:hypothetical protein, partial [Aeromonas caviae]|uniref:hypothetical protein n=1 Tax=Aeromonas caviae TaxID=648 RepID=UPI0025B64999
PHPSTGPSQHTRNHASTYLVWKSAIITAFTTKMTSSTYLVWKVPILRRNQMVSGPSTYLVWKNVAKSPSQNAVDYPIMTALGIFERSGRFWI